MDVKSSGSLKNTLSQAVSAIPKNALFYPLRFVASFFLSRSIILGSAAPFGLAASAVLGTGKGALWGLLGTVLGYLSVLDYINSLKYIACVILIFTAHFVFEDTSLYKKRLFSPLSVAIPMVCIYFVFLAESGFKLFETSVAVFEIALALWLTYAGKKLMHHKAFRPSELSPYILTAACAFTVAFCDLNLFGLFSVGRAIAFAIVFLCSFSGGTGIGACVGTLIGFSISLKFSAPELCMLYGVCGICSGFFFGKSKLQGIITAWLSALLISLCLDPTSLLPSGLELLCGCMLFLTTSDVFLRNTRQFFSLPHGRSDFHLRVYASRRLDLASKAFSNLSRSLAELKNPKKTQEDNPSAIFERTCLAVCKKCKLREICWQRDYQTTRDCLNNASRALQKNGVLSAKDFPVYFSSRCLHIEKFIGSINREIISRRCDAKFENKLNESRYLITKQYSDAATIFSDLSSDILTGTLFDETAEAEIHTILTSNGIFCESAVYRDSDKRANLHFYGRDLRSVVSEYEKYRKAFEAVLGTTLDAPIYTNDKSSDEIIIREKPALRGVFAASTLHRNGSPTSGDSGSFFSPANGKLALLLSDGMGSGKLAASESARSVVLLESLLKSGITPENALSTLHSALTLRTEESGVFSTLDLFYADMFTGRATFYKFGAAPTYIKRGEKIRRIFSSSLPAGIVVSGEEAIDKKDVMLEEGDFVIMTSDGISDPEDEEKLMQFISRSSETSPKALADTIIAYAMGEHGKNDDMTVAVVLIEKNTDE